MKPELISPAGDLEKLKIAFQYGADAVCASTPKFSMRTREIGFDKKSIKEGIDYAHSIGKKVYLTINVFPHPSEIKDLEQHILDTIKLKPDAIIVADPGVLEFVHSNTDIPIHLSTQANTTNQLAAEFWRKQGVSRIVLARELSLEDIKIISDHIAPSVIPTPSPSVSARPSLDGCLRAEGSLNSNSYNQEISSTVQQSSRSRNDKTEVIPSNLAIQQFNNSLQLEAFVHGAMCMAYSGRCQISNYFVGRDPNKGACVQPCRFKYKMYGLEEDLRPGEQFQVYEDDRGSYLLNSKDLCMIEHIPDLIDAGISSFKLEGRLKSIYYVGIVTRAYRKAIDLLFDSADKRVENLKYDKEKKKLFQEVAKTSNRDYTTGFYYGKPDQNTNNYKTSRASVSAGASLDGQGNWGFVGLVKSYDHKTKTAIIEAKNYLPKGAECEIVTPNEVIKYKLDKIIVDGDERDVVHADTIFEIEIDKVLPVNSFLRMKL